jgi:hypothetical protein
VILILPPSSNEILLGFSYPSATARLLLKIMLLNQRFKGRMMKDGIEEGFKSQEESKPFRFPNFLTSL